MNELTAFQAQAANLTLHNILNGTTFYISDVTGLANLGGKNELQTWKLGTLRGLRGRR